MLAATFSLPAPMVTALLECHVHLPRSESYLTEYTDTYGDALVNILPRLGGRLVVDHPSQLRTLFEDSCHRADAATCLATFADTVHR